MTGLIATAVDITALQTTGDVVSSCISGCLRRIIFIFADKGVPFQLGIIIIIRIEPETAVVV